MFFFKQKTAYEMLRSLVGSGDVYKRQIIFSFGIMPFTEMGINNLSLLIYKVMRWPIAVFILSLIHI